MLPKTVIFHWKSGYLTFFSQYKIPIKSSRCPGANTRKRILELLISMYSLPDFLFFLFFFFIFPRQSDVDLSEPFFGARSQIAPIISKSEEAIIISPPSYSLIWYRNTFVYFGNCTVTFIKKALNVSFE
jgi:hypothetical protein